MDNLGAIGGPLLALGLVALVGVRTAIALSVIPGLLAALSIFYAIRHIPRATSRERVPLRITVRPLLRGCLRQVLLGVSLFEAGNVATTLLMLRATQQLTPGLGLGGATQAAIGLYIGYNIAATLVSLPAGRLADRWGAIRALTVGVLFFLLAYLDHLHLPGSLGPDFLPGIGEDCATSFPFRLKRRVHVGAMRCHFVLGAKSKGEAVGKLRKCTSSCYTARLNPFSFPCNSRSTTPLLFVAIDNELSLLYA